MLKLAPVVASALRAKAQTGLQTGAQQKVGAAALVIASHPHTERSVFTKAM